jgi:hypothetical protein
MTEAYAVVERWGETFNEGDADAVARLYAPAATIWGTLGQHLTTSPADIRTYFIEAARAGLRVKLGPHILSPIFRDLRRQCRTLRIHADSGRTNDDLSGAI